MNDEGRKMEKYEFLQKQINGLSARVEHLQEMFTLRGECELRHQYLENSIRRIHERIDELTANFQNTFNSFNRTLIWLIVVVAILGLSSGGSLVYKLITTLKGLP